MSEAPERIWIDDERPIGGKMHVFTETFETDMPGCIEYIRKDLTRPKVKPLEWEDYPVVDGPVLAVAHTMLGTYFICDDADDFSGMYCELVSHQSPTWYGTVKAKTRVITQYQHVDDASPLKDMAQSDFERCLLSALEQETKNE